MLGKTTMENKLSVIAKESGIEQTKAQMVLEQFQSFFEQASEWESKARAIVITDASQLREMKQAKDARLNLRDIRTAAERTKKKLKAGIIVEGRLIDGMYNVVAGITKPIEDELFEKEKFAERKEAERIAAMVAERAAALEPYGIETQFYNLGDMSEESFQQLLDMSKAAHDAKIEEARKAEAERIAKEAAQAKEKARREREATEERERIKAENERLRAEREEREREIAKERAKAEAEKKAAEAKARAEREEREELARINAEEERLRAEARDRRDRCSTALEIEAGKKEIANTDTDEGTDFEKMGAFCSAIMAVEMPSVSSRYAINILDRFEKAVLSLVELSADPPDNLPNYTKMVETF